MKTLSQSNIKFMVGIPKEGPGGEGQRLSWGEGAGGDHEEHVEDRRPHDGPDPHVAHGDEHTNHYTNDVDN